MYIIQINEEQRRALLDLMRIAVPPEDLRSADHPLDLWDKMLDDLPIQEAKSPGIIHGFCL